MPRRLRSQQTIDNEKAQVALIHRPSKRSGAVEAAQTNLDFAT